MTPWLLPHRPPPYRHEAPFSYVCPPSPLILPEFFKAQSAPYNANGIHRRCCSPYHRHCRRRSRPDASSLTRAPLRSLDPQFAFESDYTRIHRPRPRCFLRHRCCPFPRPRTIQTSPKSTSLYSAYLYITTSNRQVLCTVRPRFTCAIAPWLNRANLRPGADVRVRCKLLTALTPILGNHLGVARRSNLEHDAE